MAILLCEEVVISGIDKASDVSLSKTESCIFLFCSQGHVHMWGGGLDGGGGCGGRFWRGCLQAWCPLIRLHWVSAGGLGLRLASAFFWRECVS